MIPISMVILGAPGLGKSTLAGSVCELDQVEKVLLLVTKPGEEKSYLYQKYGLTEEAELFYDLDWNPTLGDLKAGAYLKLMKRLKSLQSDDTYDAIIIDPGTDAVNLLEHHILEPQGVGSPGDLQNTQNFYRQLRDKAQEFVMYAHLLSTPLVKRPKFVLIPWHCFSSDTEILTQRGWVSGKDLVEWDKVAAWKDSKISWENPEGIYIYEKGHPTVLEVNQRSGPSFCVTPEHGIIHKSRRGSSKDYVWDGWFKKEAQDAKDEWHIKVPVAGFGGGTGMGTGLTDAELRLVGLVQTEGYFDQYFTRIGQSASSPVCDYIRNILDETGYSYTEYVEPRKGSVVNLRPDKTANDDMRLWTIHKEGHEFLQDVLIDGKLIVPELFLFHMTEQEFEIYLEALIVGDGTKRGKNSSKLYTAYPEFADGLQALAATRGWRCIVSETGFGKHRQNLLCLYFHRTRIEVVITKKDWEEKPNLYPYVWCLTVPSGAVLTRRNGRTCVLSNTQPPKDGMVINLGQGVKEKQQSADQKGAGIEYEGMVLPMIEGGYRRKLAADVDLVVYCDIETKRQLDPKMKKMVEVVEHQIQVVPNKDRHSKIRIAPTLAGQMIPNNMKALLEAVEESQR